MNDKHKESISALKKEMLDMVKKNVESRHIHGEYMEINVQGQIHKMLHYASDKKHVPVYFDIHGGGFCWGMMEEGDLLCHHINEQLDFEVYALDYPLGPDRPFPTALNYLYDIVHFFYDHAEEYNINKSKMFVGGRSAGGNLSAALCLLAKEKNEFQFCGQVLDHPALDFDHLVEENERYSGEGALSFELREMLAVTYASEKDRKSYLCSPLHAAHEQLEGIPATVIQTCELDSLRPEGEYYGERLKDAGVKVIMHCYPKVLHGFTEVEGPEELKGQQWLIDGIKKILKENE